MPVPKKFLSAKEVSELTGISHYTLANWRVQGRGPEYLLVGRMVRYDVANVEAWLRQFRKRTTEAPRAVSGE
jgi:predicted DNA-binding transcriptional regulator AlpA